MDLGIAGRRASVCASSRGLGRACAEALADEGVDLVIDGRDPERLERTAADVRHTHPGASITAVAADVTTIEGRAGLLVLCPAPGILINNNVGPTPGPPLDASYQIWSDALNANMLEP